MDPRRGHDVGAAQQGFDSRQQFHRIEGLGEIVIGANLESQNFVEDLPTGGQHQDGHDDASHADVPAHIEAALPGKHDIQYYEVVGISGGFVQTFLAVEGELNRIALAFQAISQSHANYFFILDDKNFSVHDHGLRNRV